MLTSLGVPRMAAAAVTGSAALAAAGLTLSNWASIAASLASISTVILGGVYLVIRMRRPHKFIEPPAPPPHATAREREAYYHALEQYNDAIKDDQP